MSLSDLYIYITTILLSTIPRQTNEIFCLFPDKVQFLDQTTDFLFISRLFVYYCIYFLFNTQPNIYLYTTIKR